MYRHEIHITGDEKIIDYCKNVEKIKTIIIDDLRKDGSLLKREYMTSFEMNNFNHINEIVSYMNGLALRMKYDGGVKISRMKVEVPYLLGKTVGCSTNNKININFGLYVESHFKSSDFIYPTSRNLRGELLATKRLYRLSNFSSFLNTEMMIDFCEKQRVLSRYCEICLYDTNQILDKEWMDLYA